MFYKPWKAHASQCVSNLLLRSFHSDAGKKMLNSMLAIRKLKNIQARSGAQWQRACLECDRPWVTTQKNKISIIKLQIGKYMLLCHDQALQNHCFSEDITKLRKKYIEVRKQRRVMWYIDKLPLHKCQNSGKEDMW